MTILQLQPEAVDAMRPFFVGRAEPNFSWQTAIGSHLFLPGVTGFWPGSILGNGVTPDLTGNGQTMTLNTVTQTNIGMAPCFSIPNTTSYLNTADGVLNSPTTIMFFACWIRITTLTGASVGNGIVNKWGGAGNRSWRINLNSTNNVNFEVSGNGTTSSTITSVAALVVNAWYHIAAVLFSGGPSHLYVNGVAASNFGSTAIFDGTADLELGRASSGGSDGLRGYMSLPTFGLFPLPEVYFTTMYQYEKALYGYN